MADDTESCLTPHLEEMNALAAELAAPVLAFYKSTATAIPNGMRPLAALNAVASLAGMILAGTDCDETAMRFFADAVVMQAVAQMDKADDAEPSQSEPTTRH